MDKSNDTYKTLVRPSKQILFKDKKSKFFGYAFPIQDRTEVKPIIEALKKQHHTAGHVCYAWQLGVDNITYRANDDGEPNNSAGMPIYGQVQSFGVTNVLVAIVRIFGGTKLGVGGLITAYRTAAHMALSESKIIEKIQKIEYELRFEYAVLNKVMRFIKQQQLVVVSQHMETSCWVTFAVRKSEEETIRELFDAMHDVNIKKSAD
ncbi:IMPACT family protein [Maribacter sp. 2307UL18-2]|uniref:IMPACT family protein n=1 Tax=Maribacter sp. 2307UL18-2 TaxID=3386274 RepID=UPI0039BCD5B5